VAHAVSVSPPPGATKHSHDAIRSRCKAVVLGTLYGMQAQTLAGRLDMGELEAKQLLRAHRHAYGRFWQWSQAAVDSAMLLGRIDTVGFAALIAGIAIAGTTRPTRGDLVHQAVPRHHGT